ncbi:ZIP family metal transporter [Salinarimonas ramus]|uniref:ZIP family metal transporter n=1 Tax=Salinarimonas ramus TaxID=690164 RepID=A0A917Q891_9HYPH|nr:ZIP family metal transporter [Salinarimonas ramus]GGK33812.1 ZIP family metal transporter [Salinarimonas ramus]
MGSGGDVILVGFLASLGAGLVTGLGAIPVLFVKSLPRRLEDAALGFAAGVMLAASFFSLIGPGIAYGTTVFGVGEPVSAAIVVASVLAGASAIDVLNRRAPHEHFVGGREGPNDDEGAKRARIWLFVTAIALHNLPEGLAVGVAFGGDTIAEGVPLALAIGLQNAPEGLSVALALAGLGYSRPVALGIATATGLVEGVSGLLGVSVVTVSEPLLPIGLGFAAGAMLYVISHEIIPETHRAGHQRLASAGLMIGLAVMTFLDTALG